MLLAALSQLLRFLLNCLLLNFHPCPRPSSIPSILLSFLCRPFLGRLIHSRSFLSSPDIPLELNFHTTTCSFPAFFDVDLYHSTSLPSFFLSIWHGAGAQEIYIFFNKRTEVNQIGGCFGKWCCKPQNPPRRQTGFKDRIGWPWGLIQHSARTKGKQNL